MKSKDLKKAFTLFVMIAVVAAISYFAYLGSLPEPPIVFSQDNEKSPIKTLKIDEVKKLVDKTDNQQVVFVGCRYCPHCQAFEPNLEQFVKDMPEPFGNNRQTIVKWEAGYECYLKEGDPNYQLYNELAGKLLGQEGVPQLIYLKDGQVKDKSVGNISLEELKEFYKRNQIPPYAS